MLRSIVSRSSSVKPLIVRGFRASKPTQNPLAADYNNSLTHYFHQTSYVLALIVPVAVVANGTFADAVVTPIDYTLGLILPFHMHVGLNQVVTDYVPKATRLLARVGVLGITLVAVSGIAQLNIEGPGLTKSVLAMWKPREKKD